MLHSIESQQPAKKGTALRHSTASEPRKVDQGTRQMALPSENQNIIKKIAIFKQFRNLNHLNIVVYIVNVSRKWEVAHHRSFNDLKMKIQSIE